MGKIELQQANLGFILDEEYTKRILIISEEIGLSAYDVICKSIDTMYKKLRMLDV